MVVSTGVGGGIVLDGRLLDGATGNAGHVGHVIVEPDGHECGCGARGCVEAEASGTAIERITGRPPAEAPPEIIVRSGTLVGRAVASRREPVGPRPRGRRRIGRARLRRTVLRRGPSRNRRPLPPRRTRAAPESSPAPSAPTAPSSAPPPSRAPTNQRAITSAASSKLRMSAAVDDDGAVLVHGLEDRFAGAVDPHLHGERVAGITGFENRASMTLELVDVGAAQRVQQRPAGDAVRAQSVEDRLVEARELGDRRVGVQRVAVARQAVEQRPGRRGSRTSSRDRVSARAIFGGSGDLVVRGSLRSHLHRG